MAGGNGDGHGHGAPATGKHLAILGLGALGVVYGDIGTSPIYALREAFHGGHLTPDRTNVLGALSVMFWALVIIVTVKYLMFVMRASNHGEGGILALTSLIRSEGRAPGEGPGRAKYVLVLLGLFGTALLYGDGMITPAISVLSAVEGLEVKTSALDSWVVPIAVAIIVGLFSVQRFGTGKVGSVFGPIMVLWFVVLAVLGLAKILEEPAIFQAMNPIWMVRYFGHEPWDAFVSMGSLFLVVTGGEALYADMGHFGRKPIALGWFVMVFPALLLNYFGQGAHALANPDSLENPFYAMTPDWALLPVVILAMMATIIASQALISGVFSLTQQAMRLGYAPRGRIEHTSSSQQGQIYIAHINWGLMLACVALVVGFGSSTNLAAAYGLAVTATMVVTTLIFGHIARSVWGWSRAKTYALVGVFLVVDTMFLAANVLKIPKGGWFPLVVALAIFTLLTTWKLGRRLVAERIRQGRVPLRQYAEGFARPNGGVVRTPGTAVFMFSQPGLTPPALLADVRLDKALQETVYVVAVITDDVPHVHPVKRVVHEPLVAGFHQIVMHYGFMDALNVHEDLAVARGIDVRDAVYFLGREQIQSTDRKGMARWREALFVIMTRNASSAVGWFGLPNDRVMEIGQQVEI